MVIGNENCGSWTWKLFGRSNYSSLTWMLIPWTGRGDHVDGEDSALTQVTSLSHCNTAITFQHCLSRLYSFVFTQWIGIVVFEESKVLILEDQFASPYPCPRTTNPCPWTTKSSKVDEDFAFCKQSIMCDHVKSINSVTAMHHVWGYSEEWLTLLISDTT